MRKKILCCVLCLACLLLVCLSLASCESEEKTTGLHKPIVVDNVSVEIIDFFGDSGNTYFVVNLLLSEHDSVYDGQLSSVMINTEMQGGYSFYCVRRDEIEHTQTYLIHINAPAKGEIELTFNNYRSIINPMNRIVDGEWLFSIDSKEMNNLNETITIEDKTLKHIKLFDNAIIILPSTSINFEEFKSYKVLAYNAIGEEIPAVVNSMSENNCYFSFVFLRFEKQDEVEKITINNIDYFIDSKGG